MNGNLVGMINVVFNVIFEVANLLLVINLVLVINKFFKKKLPTNFVFLLCYLILSMTEYLLFELNRFSFITFFENQKFIDLFFALIHFSFLAFFIKNEIIINKKKLNNLFFYVIGIIILLLIFFDKINSTYYSVTVSNLGLILFCSIYFNSIMKAGYEYHSNQTPAFFIVSGVFLGTSMLLPIILFGLYLKTILSPNAFFLISTLAPISSIIMYSFFIKAILSIK